MCFRAPNLTLLELTDLNIICTALLYYHVSTSLPEFYRVSTGILSSDNQLVGSVSVTLTNGIAVDSFYVASHTSQCITFQIHYTRTKFQPNSTNNVLRVPRCACLRIKILILRINLLQPCTLLNVGVNALMKGLWHYINGKPGKPK